MISAVKLTTSTEVSEAEWKTRVDLAALYRILDHLDMTYLIYTHLSARVPGEENTFLINRFGEMFGEVTASSLIKMDFEGNVIGEGNFSRAGFAIHSAVYMARPDVTCVLHTHSVPGSAVSTVKHGLLPISQDALEIYDELGYHDYDVPGTMEECEALGKSCAEANSIILRNHGLLTVGSTIPSAFIRMYYLERACAIQVAAGPVENTIIMDPKPTQTLAEKLQKLRASGRYGEVEWQALLRVLERKGSDYAR